MGKDYKNLTDTELELMTVLWQLGEGNVKAVQSALDGDRKLAYTSISTMLRILVRKGFCKIREEGRNHVYQPAVSRKAYEDRCVEKMVDQVFEGNASNLIMTLASKTSLTSEEKKELLKILENS